MVGLKRIMRLTAPGNDAATQWGRPRLAHLRISCPAARAQRGSVPGTRARSPMMIFAEPASTRRGAQKIRTSMVCNVTLT